MKKCSPMSSNGKGTGPLLQLDDVGLVYQDSNRPQRVLQHISLSLDEGQHLTVEDHRAAENLLSCGSWLAWRRRQRDGYDSMDKK